MEILLGLSHHYAPKVLLVDDDLEQKKLFESYLEGIDCQLYYAGRGQEALDLIEENEFALILTDIQMPEMDGYDLVKKIKSEEKCNHIPVVFISGVSAEDFESEKAYEIGVFDFIIKPFRPKVVQAKLRMILDLYGFQKNITGRWL